MLWFHFGDIQTMFMVVLSHVIVVVARVPLLLCSCSCSAYDFSMWLVAQESY